MEEINVTGISLPRMEGWNGAYAAAFLHLLLGRSPGELKRVAHQLTGHPYGTNPEDQQPYFLPRTPVFFHRMTPIEALRCLSKAARNDYCGLATDVTKEYEPMDEQIVLPNMAGWNSAYAVGFLHLLLGRSPDALIAIRDILPALPFDAPADAPSVYFLPYGDWPAWEEFSPLQALQHIAAMAGHDFGGLAA
jgi:hypothetical protein